MIISKITAIEKFMSYVFKREDGCWIWIGGYFRGGYGSFSFPNQKQQQAHRWIYEKINGPLGKLWCLHKCDNPSCVNPDHLFAGTRKDNEQDKIKKGRHNHQKKTHCPNGHEYFGYNLIMHKNGRRCRECNKEGNRLQRIKNK